MHTKEPNSRLEGLDLARYLAFVGMVIVNFNVAMGTDADHSSLQRVVSALHGRAAAVFVVLAGIGLGLGSAKRANARPLIVRRACFLLVLGLLDTTIFSADILHYYAFYFLFGVLFLKQDARVLTAGIVGVTVAFVSLTFAFDCGTSWNWSDYSYRDLWSPTGFLRNLFFNGWHPVFPWLGFLLFGLLLARMPLRER